MNFWFTNAFSLNPGIDPARGANLHCRLLIDDVGTAINGPSDRTVKTRGRANGGDPGMRIVPFEDRGVNMAMPYRSD